MFRGAFSRRRASRRPAVVTEPLEGRALFAAIPVSPAALLPDGRLYALAGDTHLPWLGDQVTVVRAVSDFLADKPTSAVAPATGSPLSEREQELLRLVADGLTNEQIARRLIVSVHTVHRHVANIRLKLNQPSRGAAASYAVRHELI